MKDHLLFYLNDERRIVHGDQAFLQMSDYLRYECGKTGTKVVCAEGDCGACTVLKGAPDGENVLRFEAVNACIAPVYLFDGCHVVTVEGLKEESGELHPVQTAMVECFGAQCGY